MDNAEIWKRIGKVLGLVVFGSIVGSVVGILFGLLFAEIFRELLIEAAPLRNVAQQVENAAIALYSHVFVGLGWAAGFVVGGATGLLFARE